MRNLKLCLSMILAAGLFMTMSCKKGDTGPAGPAGPDSVKYSNWTALALDGVVDQSTGDSAWIGSITAPSITSTIMNTGSVVGYLLLPDPLTANGDSSAVNASLYLEEHFAVGKIDLVSYIGDLSGIGYRYVVIPAKVAVTGSDGSVQTYTREQMSKMDYTTLTGVLHIPANSSGTAHFQ